MKYLVDTNILIDALKKQPHALETLKELSKYYRPAISYISLTEIRAGIQKKEEALTLFFLNSFEKIPVSEKIALLAGELIFSYARKGKTLHFQDALIATTCITHKYTLATGNIKDFEFIKELKILPYQVNSIKK